MRLLLFISIILTVACSSSKKSTNKISENSAISDSTAFDDELGFGFGTPPELIGGIAGLEINYPERAKRNNIQGTVFLKFVVEKNGRAKDIEVVQGIGYGCDQAAKRAIRRARFEPGRDGNGHRIDMIYSLPITFQPNLVGPRPAF